MIGLILLFILLIICLGFIWGYINSSRRPFYSNLVETRITEKYIEIRKKQKEKKLLPSSSDNKIKFYDSESCSIQKVISDIIENNIDKDMVGYRKIISIEKNSNNTNNQILYKVERKITFFNGKEYLSMMKGISFLFSKFIKSKEDRISIFMDPGLSWHVYNFSIHYIGCVVVTIHSTLSDEAILNALNESKPKIIVTNYNSAEKLFNIIKNHNSTNLEKGSEINKQIKVKENLNENKPNEISSVKGIIIETLDLPSNSFGKAENKHIQNLEEKYSNINLKEDLEIIINDLELYRNYKGAEKKRFTKSGNEITAIIYTSGTSKNKAKGVVITNSNIVSSINSFLAEVSKNFVFKDSSYLSFLPPAHVYEYIMGFLVPSLNTSLVFGNSKSLVDETCVDENGIPLGDINAVKPKLMACVPLVLSRIKTKVEKNIKEKGKFAYLLYRFCYKMKTFEYKPEFFNKLFDFLIFRKIQNRFGGNLKFLLCGGAALQDDLKEFCRIVLGCLVIEGYGLTETCAAGFMSLPFITNRKRSFVGIPGEGITARIMIDRTKIKLDKELNFLFEGKLLLKGKNIATKYLGGESALVNEEGEEWLDTKDVALVCLERNNKNMHEFNSSFGNEFLRIEKTKDFSVSKGASRIVGREREIIKLNNGEFINIVELEENFKEIRGLENCAIIVESWMERPSLLILSKNSDKYNENYFLRKIEQKEVEKGVTKSCKVRKIKVVEGEWNIENGVLTPTMKLRRFKLKERYRKFYEELVNNK